MMVSFILNKPERINEDKFAFVIPQVSMIIEEKINLHNRALEGYPKPQSKVESRLSNH